jgi:diacylglycerol kinase (ATP)
MQKNSAHIKRIIKSSKYSLYGFKLALKEGAFRLELYCMLFNLAIFLLCHIPWWLILIMLCSWLFTLVVEILNTAIEACIDRIGSDIHNLSKAAKDLGSAAVFLALLLPIGINIATFIYIFILL